MYHHHVNAGIEDVKSRSAEKWQRSVQGGSYEIQIYFEAQAAEVLLYPVDSKPHICYSADHVGYHDPCEARS